MGEANELVEEAARLAEQARELQDSAAALLSKAWNEEQALRQRALALESDIKRLRSSVDSAAKKNPAVLDPKIAGKVCGSLLLTRSQCVVAFLFDLSVD